MKKHVKTKNKHHSPYCQGNFYEGGIQPSPLWVVTLFNFMFSSIYL
jgi:hypothetical protein